MEVEKGPSSSIAMQKNGPGGKFERLKSRMCGWQDVARGIGVASHIAVKFKPEETALYSTISACQPQMTD